MQKQKTRKGKSKMKIRYDKAKKVVERMIQFATENKPGRPVSAALVDESGVLVCFDRMDGASPLTAQVSFNKAYTAVHWQKDTKEVMAFMEQAKRDIAWYGNLRLTPIPGGVLLRSQNGDILGAVGTSGRLAEEDEEISQEGKKFYQSFLKNDT